MGIFKHIIRVNLKILEIQKFDNFRKEGRLDIPKIRFIKSWKSRIWDQYLPENMKQTFGKFSKPETKSQETKNTKKQAIW